MKTVVMALIIIFACAPAYARCKHPWLTNKYRTEDGKIHFAHECWWNSEEWYPQSGHEYDDFSYREKNKIPLNVERPIDHWMVSFKFISGMEGDCGVGQYRIILRNSTPVPMQPEFRYELLTVYSGSCGDNVWGATIGEDDVKTVKFPPYDFAKEEKWVP